MQRSPLVLAAALIAALVASPVVAGWDDGVAAYRAGRYDDAVAQFRAFVERSPEAADGHFMLGLSLLGQKQSTAALSSLGQAVELGGGEARYRLALAQAQLKTGDAEGAFGTLAAQDPAALSGAERKSFNPLLAKAADLGSRPAEAFSSVEKALLADPKSKPLWQALANAAGRLDRPAERFRALAKAFELDPADAEAGRRAAHAGIALAQASNGDAGVKQEWYEQASVIARRLASAEPSAEHLMLAGSAEMGAQEYQRAVGWFEKALAAGGDDALARYYLGRSNLALGRDEEALDHLQAALDADPGPERALEIHAARALAFRGLEDFDRAAEAYRLAGDPATAAEMEGYAKNRAEWAQAKADCVGKRAKIRELLADSDGLEGTPEWAELEREADEILAACAPYFQDHT